MKNLENEIPIFEVFSQTFVLELSKVPTKK